MKHRLRIVSLLALAAFSAPACTPPDGPTVNVNVNVQNVTTINLANPVQSAQAGCPAISKIRVSYPESLKRGDHAPLSATPLDSDSKARPATCDQADGITWSASPSELVSIGDRKAFDTDVTAGQKTGIVHLSVDVGKSGTNSFQFEIL